MFERSVDGIDLHFHLAGINNQNFLMRDEQTGTFWQQITGLAISGPLRGHRLALVPADELTFGTWRSEEPNGTLLNDDRAFVKQYSPENWDDEIAKMPTVLSFAEPGIQPRDLMLGIHTANAARAFPYNLVVKEKLIQDRVGTLQVVLVLSTDNRSVRAFEKPDGYQFYRSDSLTAGAIMLDAKSGSEWNFQGCAVAGDRKGDCLRKVSLIRDYWFDWRNYNPQTTVFGRNRR